MTKMNKTKNVLIVFLTIIMLSSCTAGINPTSTISDVSSQEGASSTMTSQNQSSEGSISVGESSSEGTSSQSESQQSEPEQSSEVSSSTSSSESPNIIYYPSYGSLAGIKDLSYSNNYIVKVNNKPIEVLKLANNISQNGKYIEHVTEVDNAHIAMFGLGDAEVTIEVTCSSTINTAVVRPISYGIKPVINGKTLTFKLNKTNKYMSIEINGWTEPLFLFVDAPETYKINQNDPSVKYFGPGVHNIGPQYKLESFDTVYIAPGAIVNGSFNAAFTLNVTIKGRGILNGSNWLRQNEATDYSNYAAINAPGADSLTFEGISFIGHNNFTTCSVSGRNNVFRQFKAVSFGLNSDGINLFYNTKAYDCFLFADDDLLRFYSGTDGVVAQRIVCWKHTGGNVFVDDRNLWEIKNIEFRNIDVIHNETPKAGTAGVNFNGNINLKYMENPSYMSNIRFYDVNIENNNGMAIEFDLTNLFPWYKILPAYEAPNIRDILFSNVTAAEGMTTVFKGIDSSHSIENLYFNNFRIGNTVAGNKTQANMTTNSFVRDIYFNQGMVALTNPDYNGLYETGENIKLKAATYDFSSSVSKVEFYIDGSKVGESANSPYEFSWKATQGIHTVLAVASSGGSKFESSEMKIYVGKNILSNPGFENSDVSMWKTDESGVNITRTMTTPSLEASPGSTYYAKVSARSSSLIVIKQDVTSALKLSGQGTYGLQTYVSYKYTWGGTEAALKVVDSGGTKYYKSRGVSIYNKFWPTCDMRFQNISWTGDLIEATYYVYSSDETNSPNFAHPVVKGDTYVDNCKLSFIKGN